jgi:hypothetical protein
VRVCALGNILEIDRGMFGGHDDEPSLVVEFIRRHKIKSNAMSRVYI